MELEIQKAKTDKISLSFNRKFPLSRNDASAVLRVVASDGNLETDTILGEPKRQSMSQYCERAGLIDNKELTDFGKAAVTEDPTLSRAETQWVIHYFLSTPWRYVPNFWSELVSKVLTVANTSSVVQVQEKINAYTNREVGTEFADDTTKAAATAFLGTYARQDALCALGLFPIRHEKGVEKEQSGTYTMQVPNPIPYRAFACILADYWQFHYPDRPEIPLSALVEGDLPQLLLLSKAAFNGLLAELAAPDVALVRRQLFYTPYTITRLWDSPTTLWADLYAS